MSVPGRLGPRVKALLARERVGHLATADRMGTPHVVPIVYVELEGSLWFVIDEKPKRPGRALKRLRNLAENPRVAIVVDHYEEDWGELEYVLLHGTGQVVEDPTDWERVTEALRARYSQYRTMKLDPRRNPVVRIDPESVHHWRASGVTSDR